MAGNRLSNFGPVALTTTTTTNLINCNIASLTGPIGYTQTQPYIIIKHISIVNKSASAVSFSLYKGATGANAAGTEVVGTNLPVQGYSTYHWYGQMRLNSTDFLVGGASANTSLVLLAEGEIGLS